MALDESDAERSALGDLIRWHNPNAEVPESHIPDEELLLALEQLSDGTNWGSRYIAEDREDRF